MRWSGASRDLWGSQPLTVEDLPGGCDLAQHPGPLGTDPRWSATAWVVGGEVSSVVVPASDEPAGDPASDLTTDLTTWLGPTLGSAVELVGELPGASKEVRRPFGDEGPAVTVVHVVHAEVETVWSDIGSPGVVATVEVGRPAARGCSAEALSERLDGFQGTGPGATEPVLLTLAGLPDVPLGMPVADLVAMPGVQRSTATVPGAARSTGSWMERAGRPRSRSRTRWSSAWSP